jgi:putative transposase
VRVFEFIEAEKATFGVKFMCERLGVTRQGFYAWRKRPPSQRRIEDVAYTAVIRRIHTESRGTYGRRGSTPS